jgi:hypothetical protein
MKTNKTLMEDCSESIEKLISKAETYSKTTFEICKYNTIYRSADLFSSIAVRLVLLGVFVLFSLFLNIGIALLIGEYLGQFYYGFFIMAVFYLIVGFIFILFQQVLIKNPVCNFMIKKILNKNNDEQN